MVNTQQVIFSVRNYATDGQDDIDDVSTEMSTVMNVYLQKPVRVHDDRPDNALLEHNDADAAPVPA